MAQITPTRPQPKIITLSLLLYRCLLNLGPAAFRREYATPALCDFRQCCRDAYQQRGSLGVLRLWPGLMSETIAGLLAEYWLELSGGKHSMLSIVRRSMVASFWAFALFLFAFTALVRTADPVAPFDAVGQLHPEVAITYALFTRCGEIALLAVVLGGLPILFTAVKRAFAGDLRSMLKLFLLKPKQALLLLGAALVITICFAGYLLGTEHLFGSPATPCPATLHCLGQQSPGLLLLDLAAVIGGLTVGLFLVLAFIASLSLAILRSEFGRGMLRFALVPIGIITLAMAITTVASTIWTLRLWADAPQFAASSAGLGNGQTAWVMASIASMAIATVTTAGAFTSGLRANRAQIG